MNPRVWIPQRGDFGCVYICTVYVLVVCTIHAYLGRWPMVGTTAHLIRLPHQVTFVSRFPQEKDTVAENMIPQQTEDVPNLVGIVSDAPHYGCKLDPCFANTGYPCTQQVDP